MKTGICYLPLVPMRAEPSERAEMVTQVLYGELFEILDEQAGWLFLRLDADSYTGWCTSKMLQIISGDLFQQLKLSRQSIATAVLSACQTKQGLQLLPAGSRLRESDVILSEFGQSQEDVKNMNPAKIAHRFLHSPYLWGGKTLLGMDCSGLVQIVFLLKGQQLPRDARDQVQCGELISSLAETLPGDLVFFSNAEGNVVHVGLVFKDGQIIHASGSVQLDQLDEKGIYSKSWATYTHSLYQIRRI